MQSKNFIVVLFVIMCSLIKGQTMSSLKIKDYKSKVDSLPFFVYDIEELDTLIIFNRRIPPAAEASGANCYRLASFMVDKHGKINSTKHLSSEIDLPKGRYFKKDESEAQLHLFFKTETERLINLTEGLWFSDSIRSTGKVFIKISYYSSSHDEMEKKRNQNMILMTTGAESNLLKKELYNYGVKKFQLKKMLLAKVYFEQFLEYYPKDIDAHYNLASCYYKLKSTEKACLQWKACLELGDATVQEQILKYCK